MGIRGEDHKLRIRRTREEVEAGLTIEEAKEFREKKANDSRRRKATLAERIEMVNLLKSKFDIDLSASPSPYEELPKVPEKKRANIQEILARIRRNALKDVDEDPLLRPRHF